MDYGTCLVTNEGELYRLVRMNRSMAGVVSDLLKKFLQEEERKLQKLAEASLLDSSLHQSAVMQLGRVSLFRDFVLQLDRCLGEQNDV